MKNVILNNFRSYCILLAYNIDSDEMQHHVASDLGLHCLSITFWRNFQVRMGKIRKNVFADFLLLKKKTCVLFLLRI